MATVTPAQVATEVLNQGGSDQQAWVAAALVSGIESNGDPTDKNPTSTACGLFQFLTTTWQSNGGSKYGATACDATWQQQVTVFLNASQGNNFYPWAPDLGGSYNGVPLYGPSTGSPVANKIKSLNASGQLAFLGPVPSTWTAAVTGSKGATLTAAVTGSTSGSGSNYPDCTKAVIGEGGILGIGSATFLNECQAQELVGAFLIIGGGIVAGVGLVVLLADVGLPLIVGGAAAKVLGGKASAAKAPRPISRSRQRNLEGEAARNRGQTPAAYRKATAPSTRTVDANRAGTTMDF